MINKHLKQEKATCFNSSAGRTTGKNVYDREGISQGLKKKKRNMQPIGSKAYFGPQSGNSEFGQRTGLQPGDMRGVPGWSTGTYRGKKYQNYTPEKG